MTVSLVGHAGAGIECAGTASGAIVSERLVAVVGVSIVGLAPGTQFDVDCGALPCLLADAVESLPGDINGDGVVDGGDLGLLLSAWATEGGASDLSGDGIVDGADLGLLLSYWT